MKIYIKNATMTGDKVIVETPYNTYEFCSEAEAIEFEEYVNSDPDYEDPEIGDIVEHCYFINKSW